MDLYVCTTLRHVLFSVLRSAKNSNQKSVIVVVIDQQNLKPSMFDDFALPGNVTIRYIERKKLFQYVYSGVLGFFHKIAAIALIKRVRYFANRTSQKVFLDFLDLKLPDNQDQLFLFNDRNRVSRLFRLVFKEYQVIEDGLSNYSGSKLSFIEKLYSILSGSKREKRYNGDDNRCKCVYLLNVDKAPKIVKYKAKSIDFISSTHVKKYMYPYFKLDRKNTFNSDVIIATHPISIESITDSNVDLEIYRRMIKKLDSMNYSYVFKIHPREDEKRYMEAFPKSLFIESKVPLELLLFSSIKKPIILSIYSSAGMGFERYCDRKTLIFEHEAKQQAELFKSWKKDLSDVDTRIRNVL